MLLLGSSAIGAERDGAFEHCEHIGQLLEDEERRLHDSVDCDMESLIADKRCLLLQCLADDAGVVGDPGLASLT